MPVGKLDGRPAGEGDSHTGRMYALEESDHAKVPIKLLNNEGQPSAEVVERKGVLQGEHCAI